MSHHSPRDKFFSAAELLRIPALEVQQGHDRLLYAFAMDGKHLPRIVAVSRIRRDERAAVLGYQRPAALAHISAIRRYIESPDALMPNAIVVAFDKRVEFEPSERRCAQMPSQTGTLVIPVDDAWDDPDKPGWIVDGQQRMAAIEGAAVEHFPVCVTAFIADQEGEQRSQFILVNNTKPLPKGLVHELLPASDGGLPASLQVRRFPALLLERLNHDADSPMRHRIQTPTMPEGVIKDNSVLHMLEDSLTDGVLYRYRNPCTGEGDTEAMLGILKAFWTAVSTVFAQAWAEKPARSRLTHGVGIISLGFLMDTIADALTDACEVQVENFIKELETIDELCHWTSGTWELYDGSQWQWNELQNTPRDIRTLTNHLLALYRAHGTPRELRRRGPS